MKPVPRVEPARTTRYTPHPSRPEGKTHPPAVSEGARLPPLLDGAAADVCASWEREGRDGHTSDEVAPPLAIVAGALKRAMDGEAIEVTGLPPTLAARR